MRYKDDWPEAQERWTALWEGRCLDRPCMTVTAPRQPDRQVPEPATPEQIWLDPEYVARAALARMESLHWCGEAIPSMLLMGGWVVCYGATPRFSRETIWHDPITIDWDAPPSFELDWHDPWLRRYLAVYRAVVAAAGWDDFMVGQPCLLPGNDILAAVMGKKEFLVNLVDRPAWMRQAILTLAHNQRAVFGHCAAMAAETHAFPYGNPQWMMFWAPEEYVATQSDVSCMLSPEMFDEFVLPELDLLGREFGHVWYHLDGSRAFQHLPRLLSLPYLRVIQFTPEPDVPPNGPAWLDVYRKIQQAGKIVHISVAASDAEAVVRHLDPGLLCLDACCESLSEAEALLESAKGWVTG